MQERKLYEYAVIRIVPRVERQEFVNAGVILFSKEASFLDMKYEVLPEKILMLDAGADIALISKTLQGFKHVCDGTSPTSPIARLRQPERFRWLAAKRSTIVQTSAIHSGYAVDPDEELSCLFRYLVQ